MYFTVFVLVLLRFLVGMDGRAENHLRQEEAGGLDASLCQRAGHLQQQVHNTMSIYLHTL